MNDILIYVAIGLGIVFLVLLILALMGKGESLRKWLGPIGGIVVALVAIFGISKAGGSGDLAKIRAENDRLEKELKRLDEQGKAIKDQHEKDKQEYESKLQALETQLAAKDAEAKALENKLSAAANKTPMEWFNELPAADKSKIKEEIDKGITWL